MSDPKIQVSGLDPAVLATILNDAQSSAEFVERRVGINEDGTHYGMVQGEDGNLYAVNSDGSINADVPLGVEDISNNLDPDAIQDILGQDDVDYDFSGVQNVLENLASAVVAAGENAPEDLKAALQDLTNEIKKLMEEGGPEMGQSLKNLVSDFVSDNADLPGQFGELISDLGNQNFLVGLDLPDFVIDDPGWPSLPVDPIVFEPPFPGWPYGGVEPIIDPGSITFPGKIQEPIEPDWQADPNMTIEEQLMDLASHVLENTEGLDDKYRDAAREFIIEMDRLQTQLAETDKPAVQQSIREEMVQAADNFANRMQEPAEYTGYDGDPRNDIVRYRTPVYHPQMQALGNAAADLTDALATKYGVDLPEPFSLGWQNNPSLFIDQLEKYDPYSGDNPSPLGDNWKEKAGVTSEEMTQLRENLGVEEETVKSVQAAKFDAPGLN